MKGMEQTLALLIAGWRHTLPPAHLLHAKQRHQAGKNDLPPLRQGGSQYGCHCSAVSSGQYLHRHTELVANATSKTMKMRTSIR